jgi:hypothetical protein
MKAKVCIYRLLNYFVDFSWYIDPDLASPLDEWLW